MTTLTHTQVTDRIARLSAAADMVTYWDSRGNSAAAKSWLASMHRLYREIKTAADRLYAFSAINPGTQAGENSSLIAQSYMLLSGYIWDRVLAVIAEEE